MIVTTLLPKQRICVRRLVLVCKREAKKGQILVQKAKCVLHNHRYFRNGLVLEKMLTEEDVSISRRNSAEWYGFYFCRKKHRQNVLRWCVKHMGSRFACKFFLSKNSSDVSFTSSAFFNNASSYFLCRSLYSPLMKHVLHSSLLFSSISICEQKLKYWAAKHKKQAFDNPIHNHLRYTMLYVSSCWIPTLFVVKTTLVHQLPTLHAMCAFTLYQDGIFSYLQCS